MPSLAHLHALSRRFALAAVPGLLVLATLAAGPARAAGDVVVESRPVGAFQAVAVRAPIDVVLRQSGREAVEVRAPAAALALIQTRVVDGRFGRTLEIALTGDARLPARSPVEVTVDLSTLRALSLDGSGDVSGSQLKADELDVTIAGSGDIVLRAIEAGTLSLSISGSGDLTVDGRAGRLTARVSGSGDIDAGGLAANEGKVRIAGSGDVEVQAAKTLDVSIAGSGDVTYRGNPTLTRSVAGSGTITRR